MGDFLYGAVVFGGLVALMVGLNRFLRRAFGLSLLEALGVAALVGWFFGR